MIRGFFIEILELPTAAHVYDQRYVPQYEWLIRQDQNEFSQTANSPNPLFIEIHLAHSRK